MDRSNGVLLTVVLAATVGLTAVPRRALAQSVLGDCNCSGALDAGDPVCSILRLFGAYEETCELEGCGSESGVCLVFATSAVTAPNLGGVSAMDQYCQAAADAVPELEGRKWMAWAADDVAGPAERFITKHAGNYVLRNGAVVAEGWSALVDGMLDAAIELDELGAPVSASEVWTNVATDGTSAGTSSCNEWTTDLAPASAIVGESQRSDAGWTNSAFRFCDEPARLYCFEQSAIPICGNGFVEDGEDCEEEDLAGETCASQGLVGGTLSCAPGCVFDTSGCSATRYEDTGHGTVIDHATGLEWQKTDDAGGRTDKDARYTWSIPAPLVGGNTLPDGPLFTDFLYRIGRCRSTVSGSVIDLGLGDHCDWRIPQVDELLTIVDCSLGSPCIEEAIFGPSASAYYWSATEELGNDDYVLAVGFASGNVTPVDKEVAYAVRAVRGGP